MTVPTKVKAKPTGTQVPVNARDLMQELNADAAKLNIWVVSLMAVGSPCTHHGLRAPSAAIAAPDKPRPGQDSRAGRYRWAAGLSADATAGGSISLVRG
jgi:hypothetical protein